MWLSNIIIVVCQEIEIEKEDDVYINNYLLHHITKYFICVRDSTVLVLYII